MAIQTTKPIIGLYGEQLDGLYVRVEPRLEKSGDKVSYELYHYKDKESFLAGGNVVRANQPVSVIYGVTNDGYILYGLHQLLIMALTLTDEELEGMTDAEIESSSKYLAGQLTIVDIDAPTT